MYVPYLFMPVNLVTGSELAAMQEVQDVVINLHMWLIKFNGDVVKSAWASRDKVNTEHIPNRHVHYSP